MFALVVLGFLVAYLLVLRGMRTPAIALALVLQLACLGFYFSHSYHVNWPWWSDHVGSRGRTGRGSRWQPRYKHYFGTTSDSSCFQGPEPGDWFEY